MSSTMVDPLEARSAIMMSHTTYELLVALVVLVSISLMCVGALLILRHARSQPKHEGMDVLPRFKSHKDERRTTLLFSTSSEKDVSIESITPRSMTPLPEIRIHFSEEVDEAGKEKTPARVVVVRIGANSVGLEPKDDDKDLPPYRPLRDPRLMAAEMSEKR